MEWTHVPSGAVATKRALFLLWAWSLMACDTAMTRESPAVGYCVFGGCVADGPHESSGAADGGLPAHREAPSVSSHAFAALSDFEGGLAIGLDPTVTDALRGAPGHEVGLWTSPPVSSLPGTIPHVLRVRAAGVTPALAARTLRVRAAQRPEDLADAPWHLVDAQTGLVPTLGSGRLFQVQVALTPNAAGEPATVHRLDLCLGVGAGLLRVEVRDAATGRALPRAEVAGGPCGPSPTDSEGVAHVPVLTGGQSLSVSAPLYETSVIPAGPMSEGRVTRADATLVASGLWPDRRGGDLNRGESAVSARMLGAPGVRWRADLPAGDFPLQVILADVNGDGVSEILSVVGEHLEARRGDGELLWRSRGGVGDEIGVVIGVADLDLDGHPEIVCGNTPSEGTSGRFRLGRLTVLAGENGAVRFTDSLFDVHGGSGTASHIRPGFAQILNADLDDELEIMVSAEYSHEIRLYDFGAGIEQGSLTWSAGWTGYSNYRRLAAGDVDGDGFAEAIVGATGRLAILSGRDGSARYTPSMGDETIYGNIFLRDLVGDARPEIIYLGYTPERIEAYVQGDDGEFSTLYSVELALLPLPGRELVADVDGDGAPELVFQVGSDLQIHDGRTGGFKSSIRGALRGVPDLDGDGVHEIIVDPNGGGLSVFGADPAGPLGAPPIRRALLPGVGFANATNPWQAKYTRAPINDVRPDPGVMRDTPVHEETLGSGLIWTRSRASDELIGVETDDAGLRERWRLPMPAGVTFGVVGVADLDGDGTGEAVVAQGDGQIRVVDVDGRERARFALTRRLVTPLVAALSGPDDRAILLGGRAHSARVSGVGPLEALRIVGDELVRSRVGDADVYFEPGTEPRVVRLGASDAVLVRSGARAASVLSLDGTPRCTTEPFADEIHHLGSADFAGDGRPQFFVRLQSGQTFAFDGDDCAQLWSHADRTGFIPAVLDLNADGRADLAYSDTGERIHGTAGGDGAPLFDVQHIPLSANGLMMAGDLDGDGEDELVTSGNYCSMAAARDGTAHWFALGAESNKDHPGVLVDGDGDGAEDVVQPTNHGVYCYDGRTGLERWRYQRPTHVAFTGAVAADLDGDATLDVLVGAGDGSLILLDAGSGAEKWRVELGARPADPVVADVDGDRDAEILVSVNGELLVFDEGVSPRVALDAGDLLVSNAFPVEGDRLTLDVTARNSGGAELRGLRLTLRVDGVDHQTIDVNVPAGAGVPVRFAWRAIAGEHLLEVTALDVVITRSLRVR